VLAQPAEAEWMQHVAREMNLAETAFLYRQENGFYLRWFTPVAEVDLCGHATLASAHILWEDGHLRPEEQARFHTRSGLLTAVRRGDWIEMDFPATPAEPVPTADVPADGVPEDPVTGSAHNALTPYWSAKLGKSELHAYQASPRGGELRLRLHGDRVYISGQAITVLRGELLA
jgi:predicted PhzF superfamily epimerase YddE/YHI9